MAKDQRYAEGGNKVKGFIDKDRNTPVLSNAIEPVGNFVGGAGNIMSGNWKEGGKQLGKSAMSAIPGYSLSAWNKPPDPTYVGGSPQALAERRAQQAGGLASADARIGAGIGQSESGAGMIKNAYDQAGTDRSNALGLANTGMGLGQGGIGSQNSTIQSMLATAGQQGPSAAEAQMRMGLDQSQQAMMAQAASARGGNQAAAMRGAQANAAQMAGQVNQQAGMLRAQEQAQQRAQLIGAQQSAAGMYGGQAGLGYGMAGQGLGMAQGSTNQQGQMGANVGSIGLGQANVGAASQGQFLTAQSATDKAQLEADTQQSSAKKGAAGGLMGVASNVMGMFG